MQTITIPNYGKVTRIRVLNTNTLNLLTLPCIRKGNNEYDNR